MRTSPYEVRPRYLTRLTRKTNSPPTFSADRTSFPVDFAHAGMSAIEPASVATARMMPPTGTLAMFCETLTIGIGQRRPLRSSSRSGVTSLMVVLLRLGFGAATRHRGKGRAARPDTLLYEELDRGLLGLGEHEADADSGLDAVDEGLLR